jgi:hypothetical protein
MSADCLSSPAVPQSCCVKRKQAFRLIAGDLTFYASSDDITKAVGMEFSCTRPVQYFLGGIVLITETAFEFQANRRE